MARYIFIKDAVIKGAPSSQENLAPPDDPKNNLPLKKSFKKGEVVNGTIWNFGVATESDGSEHAMSSLLVDDGKNTWVIGLPPEYVSPVIPHPFFTFKTVAIIIVIIGVFSFIVWGGLKLLKH